MDRPPRGALLARARLLTGGSAVLGRRWREGWVGDAHEPHDQENVLVEKLFFRTRYRGRV